MLLAIRETPLWRPESYARRCGYSYKFGSHHEFAKNNFAFHESRDTYIYVFTFHENRVRGKCQKRSSLNVSPILQNRVLRFYFSKLTRVSWTFWKTSIHAAINFLRKPAIGGSERTEVWSYIKRLESEVKLSHQMLVKVFWPNCLRLIFNVRVRK